MDSNQHKDKETDRNILRWKKRTEKDQSGQNKKETHRNGQKRTKVEGKGQKRRETD